MYNCHIYIFVYVDVVGVGVGVGQRGGRGLFVTRTISGEPSRPMRRSITLEGEPVVLNPGQWTYHRHCPNLLRTLHMVVDQVGVAARHLGAPPAEGAGAAGHPPSDNNVPPPDAPAAYAAALAMGYHPLGDFCDVGGALRSERDLRTHVPWGRTVHAIRDWLQQHWLTRLPAPLRAQANQHKPALADPQGLLDGPPLQPPSMSSAQAMDRNRQTGPNR